MEDAGEAWIKLDRLDRWQDKLDKVGYYIPDENALLSPFGGRVGEGGFKHQTPNTKQQTIIMKQTKWSLIAISIFAAACSHKTIPTAQPTAAAAPAPALFSLEPKTSVVIGKQLYESSCGKCHELKNTTDYTANEWRPIMNNMADKAKFNAEQKANVLAYVINNAKNGK